MHILALAAAVSLAATASANPVNLERRATDFRVLPFSFSDLPRPLLGSATIDSVPNSNLVRGLDAGVRQNGQGIRLTLKKGGGGTAAVAPRGLYPGEAACSQVYFPDIDYKGVAMTFYTLASDSVSSQQGYQDEIDFEYFGSPYYLQINYFEKGRGGHELITSNGGKNNRMCIVNTGSEVRWYVYDDLVSAVPVSLGKQWVWFTVWEFGGPPTSPSFSMDVQAFSLFKISNLKPVPSPWPAANNCAPSRECSGDMSKIGLQTNANSGLSIQMYRGSSTFRACNFAPASSYVEMCLPTLRGGDKVAAYDKNGKEIVLDWVHTPPSGNYRKIKL
ncbi:hypothetical protein HDU96_004270 [Phlyctochytrium bullatum]|nr:hypothetical protein HDU96_004270 [Phlyctochytrium bullatum]